MKLSITDHVQAIEEDDNKGRDPDAVEDLLTKEMNRLSVRDRNDIQEEIHGVKCLAIKETPELIKESLELLQIEIDTKIPDSQKQAYVRSLKFKVTEAPAFASSSDGIPETIEERSVSSKSEEDDPISSSSAHTATTVATNTERDSSSSSSVTFSPRPGIPHTVGAASSAVSIDAASSTAPVPRGSYIHEDEFKLRFLRCDFFDVPKAALRMVTWLEMVVELFGEYALERPICLSDFSKEELRHMRKGLIQILPYRDRSGRRIMIIFPEEEQSKIPPVVKAKIAMYKLWSVGCNDTVSQEKGIVVLIWFDASFARLNGAWKIKYKFYTLNCDRVTALHSCSPDTAHYRFRRSIMTMRAGSENLNKLVFHLGESMEIHYKLQGYGIPFEHVPISWTGKVKVQYLKQWMRIRQAIERRQRHQYQLNNHSGHGSHTAGSISSDASSCDESTTTGDKHNGIIECPQLQDVVFRQGTSGVSHPGNVTFRSLIESTVIREQIGREKQILEQEQWKQQHPKQKPSKAEAAKKPKAKRPKQLAQDIYETRLETCTQNGRFLIWNNDKGWWNELTDKEQICMKIEYMVREFQKISQRSSKLPASKKNVQISSGNSRRKEHPFGQSLKSSSNSSASAPPGDSRSKNVIFLQSGTSLFQSQDGSNPFFANKRQRLLNNNNIFGDSGNNNMSMVDFGQIANQSVNQNECFGMKFMPCMT